jgi:spore maturation protein CgeB
MVLNINRDSMAKVGFSPPTRVFEAAGAGTCVITDTWAGIENFFEPRKEILLAASAEEISTLLRSVRQEQSRQLGAAMRARAMRDHTYRLRAHQVDEILSKDRIKTATHAELLPA